MTVAPIDTSPLISHLRALARGSDRGALAVLRRSLRRPPATDLEAAPHVERYIGIARRQRREASYLVAGLFGAFHSTDRPDAVDGYFRNLGDSMAMAVARSHADAQKRLEGRFTRLLNARWRELPTHLRQLIGLLDSLGIPLDWDRLLRDVQNWERPERWVQEQWARALWGASEDGEKAEQAAE